MCGIAGIFCKSAGGHERLVDRFRNSVTLMAHRGPDNFGVYQDGTIALFHYRLSIIDLTTHANQPFSSSTSVNKLVYNGELYNYRHLVSKYGIKQETHSDTEVLFKVFDDHGVNGLSHFNGIFAFAFYDPQAQKLSLVRDRLGVKPLYYIDHDDFFAFASEAKVLYGYLEKLTLNFRAMHEFLWFGSSISRQTIVEGVQKLDPGCLLEMDLRTGQKALTSYWSVAKDIVGGPVNRDDYATAQKRARSLLEMAVERQCISDVPVGAYLSGGIDSSVVVSLASKYTNGRLNTYSVSFDKNENSELPLARLVAQRYNTNHHEIEVSTDNLEADLEALVFQYDEPFADPAAIPLHLMAQQNKHVTRVILQGDGGDELFAGYGRYLDLQRYWRRKFGSIVLSWLSYNHSRRRAMQQRAWALAPSAGWELSARQVAHFMSLAPSDVLKSDWREKIQNHNPFESYREVYKSLNDLDRMQAMLYTDMQIIIPHTYLEKVDKVNMLHSIEARVPLLDNDLVDYVMRLPSSFKIRGGVTKSFLREITKDLLPSEIVSGRKQSFGTPMKEWLRTSLYPFAANILEKSTIEWGHFIDIRLLKTKLDLHRARKEDHGVLLWRAIVLLIWLNSYQSKIQKT